MNSDFERRLSSLIVSFETEANGRTCYPASAKARRMREGPYIAESAALIGNPARANILAALMDGRALTAGELAYRANVAASTTSEHLSKLIDGKLIAVTSSGRHRYYRLASPGVAQLLENMMALSLEGPPRHRPKSGCDEALSLARTCYDHIAGKLGVALADCFAERNHVVLGEEGGIVTDEGRKFLRRLGVKFERPKGSRRIFCRACLDWSERRWHIGGFLGATIAARCLELEWIERQRDSRALTITPNGERAFFDLFGFRS